VTPLTLDPRPTPDEDGRGRTRTKELAKAFETSTGHSTRSAEETTPLLPVSRALKQPGLWLTLTYLALILLMARAYV
jgi:hypothetical protein